MITVNEDGSLVLIEAVHYRYGCVYINEYDSVEEAQRSMDSGEDYGELSSVGVYVDGRPHSTGPWKWDSPDGGEIEWMEAEYRKAKEQEARWQR